MAGHTATSGTGLLHHAANGLNGAGIDFCGNLSGGNAETVADDAIGADFPGWGDEWCHH